MPTGHKLQQVRLVVVEKKHIIFGCPPRTKLFWLFEQILFSFWNNQQSPTIRDITGTPKDSAAVMSSSSSGFSLKKLRRAAMGKIRSQERLQAKWERRERRATKTLGVVLGEEEEEVIDVSCKNATTFATVASRYEEKF